jgi:hypothetical protein
MSQNGGQDAGIAVELWLSASSCASRTPGDMTNGQVPPQVIALTFVGVNISVDRFWANPHQRFFMDHPVADLLGRPAVLDPLNHTFAKFRIFDQFTIPHTPICGHQLGGSTVVTVMFRMLSSLK